MPIKFAGPPKGFRKTEYLPDVIRNGRILSHLKGLRGSRIIRVFGASLTLSSRDCVIHKGYSGQLPLIGRRYRLPLLLRSEEAHYRRGAAAADNSDMFREKLAVRWTICLGKIDCKRQRICRDALLVLQQENLYTKPLHNPSPVDRNFTWIAPFFRCFILWIDPDLTNYPINVLPIASALPHRVCEELSCQHLLFRRKGFDGHDEHWPNRNCRVAHSGQSLDTYENLINVMKDSLGWAS